MGYFNPLSYFIKTFIRIFTRKFFWVILICICLFLGYILFYNNGVFASSIYTVNSNFYNNSVINQARTKVGESVWNDESYDIILVYDAHNAENTIYFDQGYACFVFKADLLSSTYYKFTTPDRTSVVSSVTYQVGGLRLVNDDVSTFSVFDQHRYFLNSSWQDNVGNRIDVNNVWLGFDSLVPSGSNTIIFQPIRTHFDLYDDSGNFLLGATNPIFTSPYILNSSEISNWSFDNLNISLGSVVYDSSNSYYLRYVLSGVEYGIELRDYYNSDLGYFVVPRNQLTNNVILRDNDNISFTLNYRSSIEVIPYQLGNYTLVLSSQEQEDINADSDKYVQGEILEEQKKTNDKLDNIEDTITDSSVDDITNDTLPTDTTTDITSDGVNGIFTSIYNAFCTGAPQDIVFPIPYTNNNITLSPSYVSDMLNNNGASWVVLIIQAFWWYLISRFIIKDIMDKINKIKSGDIEQIETTNIRGDML